MEVSHFTVHQMMWRNEIARYHKAGFSGMTVAFVDYISELEYFAQEVLPRLERLGVRLPRLVGQEV